MSKLAQYNAKLMIEYWTAFWRVLRYLNSTRDRGLTFGIKLKKDAQEYGFDEDNNPVLVGWTDSAWADNIEDSKLISGYVFLLYGAAVIWILRKQKIVAQFSCEAEYMAQAWAGSECQWLRGILTEFKYDINASTKIFADNKGAISLA